MAVYARRYHRSSHPLYYHVERRPRPRGAFRRKTRPFPPAGPVDCSSACLGRSAALALWRTMTGWRAGGLEAGGDEGGQAAWACIRRRCCRSSLPSLPFPLCPPPPQPHHPRSSYHYYDDTRLILAHTSSNKRRLPTPTRAPSALHAQEQPALSPPRTRDRYYSRRCPLSPLWRLLPRKSTSSSYPITHANRLARQAQLPTRRVPQWRPLTAPRSHPLRDPTREAKAVVAVLADLLAVVLVVHLNLLLHLTTLTLDLSPVVIT